MFKVNWEKGDYCVRTTEGIDGKPYVELVKFETDELGRRYCFTLAFFRITRDGVSLVFVGDRPFEYLAKLDVGDIWHELWLTQLMLMKQEEEAD